MRNLFDRYADHFDHHLQDVLRYRTPELLVAALRKFGVGDACDTIDLGCGTGLCGPLLKSLSRSLVGVDLSPKMLDKARQREVYDQMACGDIVGSNTRNAPSMASNSLRRRPTRNSA